MIPNLFSKVEIPNSVPKGMQLVINQLKKSKNKEDCLRKAYNFLSKKYIGCHIYERLFDLFVTDLNKLWSKNGGAHCTNLNYLLRVLLVKSRVLKDKDIELKLTWIYIAPHQYLKIRLGKTKFVNVDAWGAKHGIKFGDYARSFNYKLF